MRDLRDYPNVTDFINAVRHDRNVLSALDEAAISGDQNRMKMVQAAISELRSQRLPTA